MTLAALIVCLFSLEHKIWAQNFLQFSSVQSVVSNFLWSHGLQYARPPCSSPTPRVYSNSCPLSQWCHPTISSSVVPFSSHLQSFPASGSFPMSWLLTLGGQSIGASASASVVPMIWSSNSTSRYIPQRIKKKNKQLNQKMGRRANQTLRPRSHTGGQQTHEKMLNIAHY